MIIISRYPLFLMAHALAFGNHLIFSKYIPEFPFLPETLRFGAVIVEILLRQYEGDVSRISVDSGPILLAVWILVFLAGMARPIAVLQQNGCRESSMPHLYFYSRQYSGEGCGSLGRTWQMEN